MIEETLAKLTKQLDVKWGNSRAQNDLVRKICMKLTWQEKMYLEERLKVEAKKQEALIVAVKGGK